MSDLVHDPIDPAWAVASTGRVAPANALSAPVWSEPNGPWIWVDDLGTPLADLDDVRRKADQEAQQ